MTGWDRLVEAMDRGLPGRTFTPADERAARREVDDRRSVERFAQARLALANATGASR